MNLFSSRSEPSAEMLAGNGPTMTYPSPPGESATPQAIASIAAGVTESPDKPITSPASIAETTTAQVAGLDIDPGYVAPASSSNAVTNPAAAQANGIFNAKTPSYASKTAAKPSGYQYGSKSSSPSSYATPPSPGIGSAGISSPPAAAPSAYAKPASLTPPSDLASSSSSSSLGSAGGFTMPDNMTPPSPSITPPPAPAAADGPAAADAPEHRIAIGEPTPSIPSIDTGAPASAPSTSAGGYTPGSTSGAVGYPIGGYTKPSPTGSSYYR